MQNAVSKFLSVLVLAITFSGPVPAAHASGSALSKCSNFLLRRLTFDLSVQERRNGTAKLRIFENGNLFARGLNGAIGMFRKPLKMDDVAEAYRRFQQDGRTDTPYFTKLVEAFKIIANFDLSQLAQIPRTGPVVFYANHPLCGMDGILVGSIIERIRPDLKIVMTGMLGGFSGMSEHAIFVADFGSENPKEQNRQAIREMNAQIKNGGALFLFPSGEISTRVNKADPMATDLEWKRGIVKMAEHVPDLTYVPIFVEAEPSEKYIRLRRRSPTLASAYILSEIGSVIGKSVNIGIGNAFSASDLRDFSDAEKLSFMRGALFAMGTPYFNSRHQASAGSDQGTDPEYPLLSAEEIRLVKQFNSR